MANTMVTERARLASDDQRWRAIARQCPPEMGTLIRSRSTQRWETAIRRDSPTAQLVGDVANLVKAYGDNLELATKTALKWLPRIASGDMSIDDARIQVTYAATAPSRIGVAERETPWDPHYPDWSEREWAPPSPAPDTTVVPYLTAALRQVGHDTLITSDRAEAIENDAQTAARHLWEVRAKRGREGVALLAAVRYGRYDTLSSVLVEGRLTALFVGTKDTGDEGALLWWWGRTRLGDTAPIPPAVAARWAKCVARIYEPDWRDHIYGNRAA